MLKLFVLALLLPVLCLSAEDWWTHAQIYQIYPRSFKDSNGDGIGDMKGIKEKLPHLADIGVTAAWISPIFVSPMKDFGYDIQDFYAVAEEYGTMQDLMDLIAEAKKLGIKILLDYVPNHSSDQCEWFKKSIQSDPVFKDYYVWHPGKMVNGTRVPPSNWISVFRNSMWTWNDVRQEYYLHQFLPEQPDLNFRNPAVVNEMNNVVRFWLEKGASGFRVDAISHLMEAEGNADGYPDEPVSGWSDDENDYGYHMHTETRERPETYNIVYGWRKVVDDYTRESGTETNILLMEATSSTEIVMEYYGNATHQGAHFPFNFELTRLDKSHNAGYIVERIKYWFSHVPDGKVTNWVAGNHDQKRIVERFGPERADGIVMLTMLLPGVAVTYQGEEIGMQNYYMSYEETRDPQAVKDGPLMYNRTSRDPQRTPFQWDDTTSAGFSTNATPWLPIPSNYVTLNLKNQKTAPKSTYKMYKILSQLRKEEVIKNGRFEIRNITDNILVLNRFNTTHSVIVILNTATTETQLDLTTVFNDVTKTVIVETASVSSNRNPGDSLESNNIMIYAYESIVVKNESYFHTISMFLLLTSLLISLM